MNSSIKVSWCKSLSGNRLHLQIGFSPLKNGQIENVMLPCWASLFRQTHDLYRHSFRVTTGCWVTFIVIWWWLLTRQLRNDSPSHPVPRSPADRGLPAEGSNPFIANEWVIMAWIPRPDLSWIISDIDVHNIIREGPCLSNGPLKKTFLFSKGRNPMTLFRAFRYTYLSISVQVSLCICYLVVSPT